MGGEGEVLETQKSETLFERPRVSARAKVTAVHQKVPKLNLATVSPSKPQIILPMAKAVVALTSRSVA